MSAHIMGPYGWPQQAIAETILPSQTQSPRHISPIHWGELVDGSGIAPDIAALNFKSFGDGFADAER